MVTPTGILSTPADALAQLIAGSATFQAWTGSVDASAAMAQVFIVAASATGAGAYTRPFALIHVPSGFELFEINEGSNAAGELRILIEQDVAEENQAGHQDAFYDFSNNVGAIAQEIGNASYSPGSLLIQSITIEDGPSRANFNQVTADGSREDYFQIWLSVKFGLGGNG